MANTTLFVTSGNALARNPLLAVCIHEFPPICLMHAIMKLQLNTDISNYFAISNNLDVPLEIPC